MHWNVPPDALPGSATFVRVLDRWLNDCMVGNFCGVLIFVIFVVNLTITKFPPMKFSAYGDIIHAASG